MAESKISVARIKDKTSGRETSVDRLLYSDGTSIKTLGGNSQLSISDAKTLNGETKAQLLANLNAATVGGKSLSQIQSRGKYGPIRLLTDMSRTSPYIHTMIVTEDEELLFCGNQHANFLFVNKMSSIGTTPWISVPHPLKGISRIKNITCHYLTQFLLYENGDLYARGDGGYYCLGTGNTANQFNWVKILDNVDKLAIGPAGYYGNRSNSAAIKKDGSVWFWGENAYGHAGMGNTSVLTTPTKLSLTFLQTGDRVKDIWLNDSYQTSAYIITEKGKLYACGMNDCGQLGLNDTTNRSVFTQVTALQDKKVEKVHTTMSYNSSGAVFYKAVVARCSDNTCYMWSIFNSFNVTKTAAQSNTPLLIDDSYFPTGYKQSQDPIIDAYILGVDSPYFLTRSGRLFVGGYNGSGYLGIGNAANQPKLVEVNIPNEPTAKIKKIYKGTQNGQAQYYSVTLLVEINNKRYLYACGANGYGCLGTNDVADNPNVFKKVLFDSDKVDQIKQIEIGGYSNQGITMILLNNGQYWACGSNSQSQVLGTGLAHTPINYPILVL